MRAVDSWRENERRGGWVFFLSSCARRRCRRMVHVTFAPCVSFPFAVATGQRRIGASPLELSTVTPLRWWSRECEPRSGRERVASWRLPFFVWRLVFFSLSFFEKKLLLPLPCSLSLTCPLSSSAHILSRRPTTSSTRTAGAVDRSACPLWRRRSRTRHAGPRSARRRSRQT